MRHRKAGEAGDKGGRCSFEEFLDLAHTALSGKGSQLQGGSTYGRAVGQILGEMLRRVCTEPM